MLKNLQNLMLVTLLALTAQQLNCANKETVSLSARVWNGAKGMVAWTGDQAAAVRASWFGRKFGIVCEAIAGVTIFATIQKVGIRSTACMLVSKPMVFPIACYSLASLVSSMLVNKYREIQYQNGAENRAAKLHNLEKYLNYADVLSLASALYFLTLAQPLSVSVASKVLV